MWFRCPDGDLINLNHVGLITLTSRYDGTAEIVGQVVVDRDNNRVVLFAGTKDECAAVLEQITKRLEPFAPNR